MWQKPSWAPVRWILVLALALSGCGDDDPASPGGSERVDLFLTDDLTTGYASVWVTLRSVRLVHENGLETVMENPEGEPIDLRSLGDDSGGRYLYVTTAEIPDRDYIGVQIDLDRTVRLQRTGETALVDAEFAESNLTGKLIAFNFAPRRFGEGVPVLLDFDLAQWTDSLGVIRAPENQFVHLDDGTGFDDPSRHEPREYEGRIANLTGTMPDLTFVVRDDGLEAVVVTDAATAVSSYSGTTNTLQDGQRVSVWGGYYPSLGALKAVIVQIEDGDTPEEEAVGLARELDPGNLRLDLDILWRHGFIPPTSTIHVQLADSTQLVDVHGAPITSDVFFGQLAIAPGVTVEGVYVPGTNTLDAEAAQVMAFVGTLNTLVRAHPSRWDAELGTIEVDEEDVLAVEGISPGRVLIQPLPTAEYRDTADVVVSSPEFFQLLGEEGTVEARGAFNETTRTLLATHLAIGPEPPAARLQPSPRAAR